MVGCSLFVAVVSGDDGGIYVIATEGREGNVLATQ